MDTLRPTKETVRYSVSAPLEVGGGVQVKVYSGNKGEGVGA